MGHGRWCGRTVRCGCCGDAGTGGLDSRLPRIGRRHDSSAIVSSPPASPVSRSDATFFSISASPAGDVTLNCGGVPIEIGYADLAPHDEIREQSQRISRQLDPLINGFSVKVTFLF
ncbi:hypothetical protein [Geobacter anodireducens]